MLISETLGKFLSGESSENLEFTENYTADTSETRASDVTGIISVTASFSGYEYQAKYQISGNLDYTLPVEDGVIQGYRVENSEESLKVSSDGFTEPKELSISMNESELAPAYGSVEISETGDVAVTGEAFPIMSGMDASFVIGKDSFTPEDLVGEEPYAKDQMAEDLYSMSLANGTISSMILKNAKPDENNNIDYQLPGEGNSYKMITTTEGNSMTNEVELRMASPSYFTIVNEGITYSVHTTGSAGIKSKVYIPDINSQNGAGMQMTATGEYDDFLVSVIMSDGKNTEYLPAKTLNGSLDMPNMASASITIGNHTYSGDDYLELTALNMAANYALMLDDYADNDGNVSIPPETVGDEYPFRITGSYKDGTFTGNMVYMSKTYALQIGIENDQLTSMKFGETVFSDEAVKYLNANNRIYSDFMSGQAIQQ